MSERGQWMRPRARSLLRVVLVGAAMAGCSGGDVSSPTVPPSVVVSSATSSTTVASGNTLALTVQVKDDRGRVVGSPSVSWTSSNAAVASVSASGVVTGTLVGQATITASALSASGSIAVVVTPGAPARLAVRTEPGGASAGQPFTTPTVVELRDAAGNAVPATGNAITVSLATGGGTLRGTLTVNTVQGAATFADLFIDGTTGLRTLAFTSPGLAGATSAAFPVAAGVPSQLAMRTQPDGAAAGRVFTTPAVVEVQDSFGNLVTSASTSIVASVQGGGTLSGATVSAVNGVATFAALTIGGLQGARTLTFSAVGLVPVTSQSLVLQAGPPALLALERNPAGAGLNGPSRRNR